MKYDFCFSNPEIGNWFNGEDTPPPVKHFKYLHTHPLVKPNFLTEIEAEILKGGADIQALGLEGKPVEDLSREAASYATSLSAFISSGSDQDALECLHVLRRIRKVVSHVSSLRRK